MAERLTGDYRKYLDKNYLGAWDVPDDGDLILTIDHVARDDVKNERGTERKLTLHFVEEYKPMILNATNARAIAEAYATGAGANKKLCSKVEDWAGKRIAIHTEKVTAFGGTTDALRIRNYPPKVTEVFCEDCGQLIKEANGYSVNKIVLRSRALFGKDYCYECSIKHKEADNG